MSYFGPQQVVVVDPESPFAKAVILFATCAFLYGIGYAFWWFLSQWATYPFPLNYSVGFYYFIVAGFVGLFTTPYDWGKELYSTLHYAYITPYENLNSVLIWSVEIIFTVIAAYVIFKIICAITYVFFSFRAVRWMVYLPAIIGVLAFVGLWLFEKPL